MRALAFICFAVAAPDAWALLDARRVLRRSNRLLSTANFGQHKVMASDAAASDNFGSSVAIDGDTVVVGAPQGFNGGSGAAYVLRTSDGGATWVEMAKLTASDAAAGDHFGISVAIDGGTVVVGTWYGNAAYVFRTTNGGTTYGQVAKLTAADAAAYDYFGRSVAIDGNTVVAGAYGDDDASDCTSSMCQSGSAYVFLTTDGGATYGQVAKLTASDASSNDYFGYSVAISGGTVVIGAPSGETAYVFLTTDGGATYGQVAKLTSSDAASGDYFGSSVAIDGDTVVVGAWGENSGTGAAYVFRTTDGGTTYDEVAKLTSADAAAADNFGSSVAIDGATVVVGARGDDGGSAYVFLTTDGGATYGQVAKLTASDAESGDQFGLSVAIYGDTVVIGARDDDDGGSASGSAYVFSPPAPTVQPTPEPSVAALESDSGHSATRAGTLATVLVVVAATALAL